MRKHTILFLAANPIGPTADGLDPQTRRVRLDQEASAIRKELKRSGYRDRFEFVTRWAAEPHDLLRELRELKPKVIHFSGHGGRNGLFFQSRNGEAQVVSAAALIETFGAAGGSVQLVVLNACYSEQPAEALLTHVDCVVGVAGVLQDEKAIAFAIGFYGALGERESVAAAYRHGKAAISLEGLADADCPQLKVRAGADAAEIFFAVDDPSGYRELPCPYTGMRPYSAEDADHFYGRGAEIDELIGRLRAGEREIYVIGPSGSGKSSLIAAGVLRRLARGVTGLGPFIVRSMRPGERPAARLDELLAVADRECTAPAAAVEALLAGRALCSSVLILIDQLEELVTAADADERNRFLRDLDALRAAPRCTVVFTLRADFYGAFMESPLWAARAGRILRVEVYPLRGEALQEAIVRPACNVGIEVEPKLVEQLLADAGSEPGILPLLQETLVQLWDRRQGHSLTLADYQALGGLDRSGLAVVLSRRADAFLRDLSQPQEAIARRILLRLISFGEGRPDTRRQQPLSKLRAADDDVADFDDTLQRLIAARLLTADENRHDEEAHVDLAHEVMIVAWPTFAGWIQTHRVDEQQRRHLQAAAAQWVEHGRGARGLLDPGELADVEAWQGTTSARELGSSIEAAEFVAASRAAHKKQRLWRRVLMASALAALAFFLIIVGMLAGLARDQAKQRQDLFAHSVQEGQEALTLAEALLQGESISEALFSLDRCIVAARIPSDGKLEGRCHLAAARALAHVGYFEEGSRELDLATQLLSTDRELAVLWLERGHALMKRERITWRPTATRQAPVTFEHALEFARRTRENDLILSIELDLAFSYTEFGDIVEAEQHLAIATALDRDRDYENKRAQLAARIAYRRGDLKGAQSQNADLYPKMPPGDERFEVCVIQARIALIRDDLAAAELWSRRGIEEVDQIQARQTAIELRLRVLTIRRAPYELLFVALARQNRFEEAVRAFDQWQGHTLLDSLARPNSLARPGLAAMAKNIRSLGTSLPAVSSVPLMSSGDRRVVEALHSIDLLVLTVTEGEVWRIIAHAGRLRIQKIGAFDALREQLDRFLSAPTDRALADALGERLIPNEMFRSASTLHVVLDEPLTSLPVAALRGGGKPLVAARPVLRLLRLPGNGDSICAPPHTAGRVTVLADANGDLPDARREASIIASQFGTTPLVGDAATSAALFAAKSDSVLHVATHAAFDSLQLHDRVVSALEISMKHLAPSVVVLAGCSTARSPEPEIGSTVTAFLAGGSSQVIATSRPISDNGATEVMRRFYNEGGVADPIRTIAAIQARLAETDNMDWPSFVVFGSNPCIR